ncbi:hypothetical protein N7510_008264 [Penicillium lagena]|uniref:uncharacterized protein n=1 Tax=Penicillium lagena TaxID=94218 RepID=UPI00253F7439|nr:uncharacterized protein N7510_008264 [Penicillium lagena]KAJ5605483.1 hypothetical protein N7510_008264 [Penicillium lagena]
MTRKTAKTNSKNGCVTCKIRHVKCGEERPTCVQCTSTGRKCDGYVDASQRQLRRRREGPSLPLKVSPESRLVLVPGTRQERDFLNMFSTETCHSLSGLFHSDLWLYYIPQLSQTQPAIRHAVAAVSAAHKCLLAPVTETEKTSNFALEQYNKAIRALLDSSHPRFSNLDLTLITCALFVCLETVTGNNPQAMDHAQAGLRILARRQGTPGAPDPEFPISDGINRELSDLFSLLNIECSTRGRKMIPYKAHMEQPTQSDKIKFTTILQARRALVHITTPSFQLVQRITSLPQNVSGLEQQERFQEQQRLRKEHNEWWIAFQQLQKRRPKSRAGASTDPRAPLVLIVQHHATAILNETLLRQDEMIYDNFVSEFEEMVEAAEKISELSPKNGYRQTYNLEPYVGLSLYWAARKCRHPLIRRRAAAVIRASPQLDSMHDLEVLYHTAIYNIEREEASVAHLPVEHRVPECQDRFWETFMPNEKHSNPCQIIFVRKEGAESDYKMEEDYVHW